MAVEGLWTIQFSETEEFYENMQVGEQLNNGGTLLFTDNKVFGGGISFYFTGSYESGSSTISMTITATRYNDIVPGAFGVSNEAALSFSGTISDNIMKLHGSLDNDKNKMIYIGAEKRADI
jgi:hypothetical protein